SNLGHLEAAAGVAGLAKAALALSRGVIPPTLGYENPNPHIPFENLRLKVVAEQTDWADLERPRRAGVSSFGFGGTNAHVVLEQAPATTPAPLSTTAPAVRTLVISGKSPARIAATAGMLSDWLAQTGPDADLDQLAHTLNHHRGGYRLFATVCARDLAEAQVGLTALATGGSAPGVVDPHDGTCRPGTVFVYSGQGSQWAGMGRRLLAEEPAFAAAVDELEPAFVEQVGFSLRGVLESGDPVSGIDRIQPVLVGLQVALTALWRSYGVHPDAVIGHSMGEVTAAVVAGALTPAQGLKVIATRSRLMKKLSGQGAMALLELSVAEAEETLAGYPGVTVAVEASPRQVVIAGTPEQVEAIIAVVSDRDRLARRVDVDVASHHSIIDPVLAELQAELADLDPLPPAIPVFVTTDGRSQAPVFDAEHWVANLRNPVRFSQAVATAGAQHGTFIEISPNPVLTYAIDDTLTDTHHHTVPTLVRDADDTVTFRTNLNAAHTTRPPETPHHPEPHLTLPSTPWQHTRHWIDEPAPRRSGVSGPAPGTVLGVHTPVAGAMGGHLWQARLAPQHKPYPGFRRIAGVEVVPASVLIRTLADAVAEYGAEGIADVRFDSPLTLDQSRLVQVFTDGESISISSAGDDGRHWVRNLSARISARMTAAAEPGAGGAPTADPSAIDEHHDRWGIAGHAYEWSVDAHEATPGRLRADVVLPPGSTSTALLDAAMDIAQLVAAEAGPGASDAVLTLPIAADAIGVAAVIPDLGGGVVEVRRRTDADDLVVDLTVRAADGRLCGEVRGLRYRVVESAAALAPAADPDTVAHIIDWQPWALDLGPGPAADRSTADRAPAGRADSGSVAVLGEGQSARALADRFAELGHPEADPADARYVLYVPQVDGPETDVDVAARLICEVGDVVARLADRDPRNPVTLWIITRGVHEAQTDAGRRQSCLWALGGVIDAEQPQLWGGVVDVGPEADLADCAAALA
ncbi:MAG: acyltransferase domain-containing protein, partial [Mycobacterium sp.]|nr:acyltransferase domain-containing protein [Mycobacterium sp.]